MKKKIRSANLYQFLLLLLVIAGLNAAGKFLFWRFDLTTEKRFTLSPTTKEKLKQLKDIVYVKVYLTGDLPAGFQRLSSATRDMLMEMKSYAGSNLEFDFIDPSALADSKQRNELFNQLADKGLQPTNISERNAEGTSERILFPGAILNYLSKEQPLLLLKDRMGASAEEMVNTSIQNLEYEIINAISKISTRKPATIGILHGQGELDKPYLADFYKSVSASYPTHYVQIKNQLNALQDYDCLVIAKPDSAFDEKDKFIIDQFIMRGGKVLWLLDMMSADMDSLARKNEFIAIPKELNLDDMLFRYGVRLNKDLVMDLQSVPIPILTGYVGNRPQNSLLPWFYYPLVTPTSKHPIVNNLNAIRFAFAGSIDTIVSAHIKKTILLQSSHYCKTVQSPAVVDLNILRKDPDEKEYRNPPVNLAVLLEGSFRSNFANRIPYQIATDSTIGFKADGKPTSMIVISDGDVIRNDYKRSSNTVYPLGMDRYTGQFYGNKNLLLNCIDYLCDNSGLMALRAKEFKLRLLDKTRFDPDKKMLQIVNVALPVLLIILFAMIKLLMRKKKFS
ncbi:MAG TPA: gliding motility-associated ABC transporter substrate-binding protein GldG [Bacteroidia bacterium]|nr:gliding motility-associated ABC transporter substrate-binding protein GldG [Bacteroidia bacterium]QQR95148.1 MAG: gliding motility-associated ABC transporter substrate-binding protein GldG [Bacteroidota bacterium]MBP7714245.1 gliding motility-associated ABC transporter substrate-binding protein GldG [Bacteroidia bacterium]MBP8669355.1 gliding motility-associated ABC transporter substrate-binding protein GldG [Bacteroidia bacterium]HOZ81657.1 gliding motility-associated ABC transporter substr